jgi:hypothetical protein
MKILNKIRLLLGLLAGVLVVYAKLPGMSLIAPGEIKEFRALPDQEVSRNQPVNSPAASFAERSKIAFPKPKNSPLW